jgi:hypothetical protein
MYSLYDLTLQLLLTSIYLLPSLLGYDMTYYRSRATGVQRLRCAARCSASRPDTSTTLLTFYMTRIPYYQLISELHLLYYCSYILPACGPISRARTLDYHHQCSLFHISRVPPSLLPTSAFPHLSCLCHRSRAQLRPSYRQCYAPR